MVDEREDQAKLTEARSRVLTGRQVEKSHKVAKRRKRKPNRMRSAKANKYWYELEAYFDAKDIEIIPVKDGGFMMGILEDFVVIEVSREKSTQEINDLASYLASMGFKSLIIHEGIKFLRLKEVTGVKAKELDEINKRQVRAEEKQKELDALIEKKHGKTSETDSDGKTEVGDSES